VILTGLDVCVANGFSALKGKRVGAIVNQTSVDRQLRHLVELFTASRKTTLSCLFAPEHGIRGIAQYMEPVEEARDPHTGLPVFSLYGKSAESLSPKRQWLEGLDALVFDVQDVGSRYYTYLNTMALSMKVAAEVGIPFHVLDRPNPIGGIEVEGNLVGERFRSFVGMFALPNRHGMTAGELAQYLNETEHFGCELSIIRCEGWRRSQYWEQTGLPFVPPSPNMPTADTALVYPGMCLSEGTNLSEGRGTCRPFEQFGAPWLDGDRLARELNQQKLPGVRFRPVWFRPSLDKHQGVTCGGAMIHVTDRLAFRPLRTGIAVIKTVRDLGGDQFRWRTDAYEFVTDIPAFDLLCGTDRVRIGIDRGAPLAELTQGFEAELEAFREKKSGHELYPA
jgi:uncharacterized protein YbbC (DUF1343 family)